MQLWRFGRAAEARVLRCTVDLGSWAAGQIAGRRRRSENCVVVVCRSHRGVDAAGCRVL